MMMSAQATTNSMQFASGALETRFGYDDIQAGNYITIMWFLAAFCNIPVGWYTGKYGKDWLIIIMGSILMLIAHSMYLFAPDCDECWLSIIPLMILGLSYSIYSVLLYTAVANFVDESMIGKAYGMSSVFINLGRVIFPPLIGYIQNNTELKHGYFWVEISFMAVSITALCINTFIFISLSSKKTG